MELGLPKLQIRLARDNLNEPGHRRYWLLRT